MQTDGSTPDGVVHQSRPKLWGPWKRWWWLALWLGCLAAVIVGQRLTARSFEHGHWTPGGPTEATDAELAWYLVPPTLVVGLGIGLSIGLRWWVREPATRSIIQAWGLFASIVTIIVSIGISLWFRCLEFYMD